MSAPGSQQPAMVIIQERRLLFESRRFALETLVKIHLEHAGGSRSLIMSHARVMLSLSLAAIAGFVTIVAAMLRGDMIVAMDWRHPLPIGLALAGTVMLVVSALAATKVLSRAARSATKLLQDPFPTARQELEDMFDGPKEDMVLDKLVAVVRLHVANTDLGHRITTTSTVSLVVGTVLVAASLLVPVAWPLA